MGFAQDNGYTPASFNTLMLAVMNGVNDQFGTSYTAETFIGTGFYKYFYALVQELQTNDVKTSEIFLKLQEYFATTNARISRPVATSPGVVEALSNAGYTASVKPPENADAGKIYVAVDVDDGVSASGTITVTSYANLVSGTDDSVTVGATVFTAQVGAATLGTGTFQAATSNSATALSLATQINAHATAGALVKAVAFGAVVHITAIAGGTAGNAIALAYTDNDTNVGATKSGTFLTGGTANAEYAADKLEINTIIKDSVAAGIVSQGGESSSIVLSNGQSFDFKFKLPDEWNVYLKLTTVLSDNNQSVILSPEEIKDLLLANIEAKYRMGHDFEPQRYFTTVDAPWAASVLLEYSLDGGSTYLSSIYESDYDEIFKFSLGNISLVET